MGHSRLTYTFFLKNQTCLGIKYHYFSKSKIIKLRKSKISYRLANIFTMYTSLENVLTPYPIY